MSSVATFQPFVDKENAVAHHPKNADNTRMGLGGKVFQSGSHSLSTPRSVLKDVNQDLSANPRQEKGLKPQRAPTECLFKKPAPLSSNPTPSHKKELKVHFDSGKKQKQVVTVQPDTKHSKKAESFPPKENMHIYTDAEEVRPKLDIDLRGVVDMFRNWRPTCWFGSREEGDSDCDSEVGNIDVPDIEDVPEPQFTAEDLLDPIPFIDEDIPIPFVDDSLDIEPNIGTLEIWDEQWLTSSPQKDKSHDDSV